MSAALVLSNRATFVSIACPYCAGKYLGAVVDLKKEQPSILDELRREAAPLLNVGGTSDLIYLV